MRGGKSEAFVPAWVCVVLHDSKIVGVFYFVNSKITFRLRGGLDLAPYKTDSFPKCPNQRESIVYEGFLRQRFGVVPRLLRG